MTIQVEERWVSPERFAAYMTAAGGDRDLASRLYEWNARVSAAIFEVVHHFEVLLRNAIVAELAAAGGVPNMPPGTPWVQASAKIDEVIVRLKKKAKDPTAARIYAGLMFGAWQQMFSSEYEEVWRHALQFVFRHNRRLDRAQISAYLESINQLRNLIAHHGSVVDLELDP